MRKIWKPRFAAFILGLLFIAPYARSRPTEGVLDGVVLNGKGAPVAFAAVLWQAADGKAPHALRANGNGYFRIVGVRQGLYDIRAQHSGMASDWERVVRHLSAALTRDADALRLCAAGTSRMTI